MGRKDVLKNYDNDHGFKEEFEHFYNAVRKGHRVKYSFEEAKRDLGITLGAISSAKTNRKITFS